MHHAAVGFLVLEVQEPVFAVFRMHPAALMGAVDGTLALLQHNLVLVGTVRRLRAHGQLEALGHTAGGTHDPVPAVALVELRPFARAVGRAVAVKDDNGLSNGS